MRKKFEMDQLIQVQREAGFYAPWESAVYRGEVSDMPGWHHIEIPKGHRYIDSMTGSTTDSDNPRAYKTNRFLIPTRRIRMVL
jgi:hypothetical protein